jgi:hypothetical protein
VNNTVPWGHGSLERWFSIPPKQFLNGVVFLPQIVVDLLSKVQVLLLFGRQFKVRWVLLQLAKTEHIFPRLVQNVGSDVWRGKKKKSS